MADLGTGFVTTLNTPDLRNGALTTMRAIVPSASIPRQYHWNIVGGVPDNRVLSYAAMNMRLQFAVLTVSDPGMNTDKRRSQAIILGAIRTGLRAYWNIRSSDISAGELGSGYVAYRAATETPAVAEGVTITWGGQTTTAATAAWGQWTDLSELEKDVAEAFILFSTAILPTVGWSLVKTGHHYLSQAGNAAKAAYMGIKKQWFTKISATAAAWVRQREEYWEDIAFHKACHPILMELAMSIASDRQTKLKLEAVDFGAAAVRLPATAPQLEYAKMVMALLTKTAGVIIASGGTLATTRLSDEIAAVYDATDAVERARHISAANVMAHSRDPLLAVCAGILNHISESGSASTIAGSFGFKRLVQEYPVETAKGVTIARSIAARERQAITDGTPIVLDIAF